jgi:hypothetical protein
MKLFLCQIFKCAEFAIIESQENCIATKPVEFDGVGTLPGFSYPENPDNCLGYKMDMGAGR